MSVDVEPLLAEPARQRAKHSAKGGSAARGRLLGPKHECELGATVFFRLDREKREERLGFASVELDRCVVEDEAGRTEKMELEPRHTAILDQETKVKLRSQRFSQRSRERCRDGLPASLGAMCRDGMGAR